MKHYAAALVGLLLLFQAASASAQAKASKVFLLEDLANNQWCSYTVESTWEAKVQETGAMTVGRLDYSNGHLSRINVTETDESGDWAVYDHYFLDDHGRLVKLLRLLNVLPGDKSVSQTFSISGGKVTKTATSEKQLSTGKERTNPTADWLPDLPIESATTMFPFASLLSLPSLRTAPESCVKIRNATLPLAGGGTALYERGPTLLDRHSDWLGSQRYVSTSGSPTSMQTDLAYAPYGEYYAVSGPSDVFFTGQPHDLANKRTFRTKRGRDS
jgi:hypothetical protein